MKVKHLCTFFFQIWSSGLIPTYSFHQLLMIWGCVCRLTVWCAWIQKIILMINWLVGSANHRKISFSHTMPGMTCTVYTDYLTRKHFKYHCGNVRISWSEAQSSASQEVIRDFPLKYCDILLFFTQTEQHNVSKVRVRGPGECAHKAVPRGRLLLWKRKKKSLQQRRSLFPPPAPRSWTHIYLKCQFSGAIVLISVPLSVSK